MKQLDDFKEDIHRCSKCGLCQAECPIYKITGNDCTVSRGQFVMLNGVIKGDLEMSKTINRYLDLCLKCGKCSKFCPSGIDVVDALVAAKHEYLTKHLSQKMKAFIKRYILFGAIPNFIGMFKPLSKTQIFDKKVLYFGGCQSKLKTDRSVVKILNRLGVEVINPDFSCCGISMYAMGDIHGFTSCLKKYISIMKRYDIKEVVTTCASCEKTLKNYIKWADEEDKEFLSEISVVNIYGYLKNMKVSLKTPQKVTYHKPCSLENPEDVKFLLESIDNLEYIEAENFDSCCGLNGLSKFSEYKILKNVFQNKRNSIINTGVKTVLTSCLGCEIGLKIYSFGKYKVVDFIDFLAANIKD